MNVEDEGGGGAKNQNSMLVLESEAVCTNSDPLMLVPEPVKDNKDDTTECSSSFGDTYSRSEDGADNGEPEVNSGAMCAHTNGGGPSKTPRRKKVTAEWRNCVRPVMWRCHWLELRMKELSSQVSKYDRELSQITKEKELQQAVSKANGFMSESMQIDKSYRNSIMKRRKRKMHEENMCESFCIDEHQILSYYHGKHNKGAETDGPLIDDNCGSTVGSSIRGVLDTATLLDSEDYDMILEQLTLKDILLTIDGVQSQVHLLQNRLNKAHSEGENLAFSEDNTHLRVPRKRQHTKKCSLSYTKCQYTKPQKKKDLNILLKDDDGSALPGRPALPDRETDTHVKDANRNAEERSGGHDLTREKAITVNLLLGTDNSIPNANIADLWKENIDDILIDNEAAYETFQQFYKGEHLPSGTFSEGQNISAPAEMKNTCSSAKADSTSAPVVEQEFFHEKSATKKHVSSGNSQQLNPKKRRKKDTFFTKMQREEASKTPAAKEKTEATLSVSMNQTGSTFSALAKKKTEGTPSAAMGSGTMTPRSARKKRKFGNESAGAKKHEFGNLFLTLKDQKTGKPSSAAKEQETEKLAAAAKGTENTSSATKKPESESAPSKLKLEKAILLAVNSRSQRVRKPKVFAE
ncbi:hypothetical protein BS78_02G233000 [Paspalum vaginatum]|nr:hypothetical protein BS78_02G233000 [Paspalum vaginatum]KAJ1290302.1 hypothetical protein BS78_02G233000 [Paspalum vaginatum]